MVSRIGFPYPRRGRLNMGTDGSVPVWDPMGRCPWSTEYWLMPSVVGVPLATEPLRGTGHWLMPSVASDAVTGAHSFPTIVFQVPFLLGGRAARDK